MILEEPYPVATPSEKLWLESLVACIPDALALVRADGTIMWSNRELSRLAGVSHGLKGSEAADLLVGWRELEARLPGDSAEDVPAVYPANLLRADGTVRAVELRIARCKRGTGAAWAIHLRDAEFLHELQRRLTDRERSHSFLQANTSDLILRLDSTLAVTWRNEAAAPFFPPGVLLADAVTDDSLAPMVAAAARFEVSLQSRKGRRPTFCFRGIVRRLQDDNGAPIGFSMLLRDDSEQMRLAEFVARFELSAREEEIVEYVIRGYSNLNIASILGLSESGVKFHIRNVFARAKVNTRTELMALLLSE